MKRSISLLVAAALVFSLVLSGCGTKTDTGANSGSAPAAASSSDTAAPAKDTAGDKPVTLSYLSWHNETTLKPVIEAFNAKYPNIKIDLQYAPPIHDYIEKAKVLFLAGETPDIFVTAAENKAEVLDKGYAEDISSLPVFSKLGKTFADTYSKDGKIYAFAPDCWIGGIYYNKKLFEKVGVTVPNSYSELLDVMKKLKDAGIKPLALSKDNLYDIPQGLFITETINSNPNYDIEVNERKHTYADGWSKPYELWYNDFVKTGYVTKEMLGITGDQVVDEFTTEKAAMMVGGPWNIDGFNKKNPNLDFDMMPFVGTQTGVKWNIGAVGVGFSIGASSKNKEQAMKYLEFLSSDEGLKIFQKATGGILGVPGIDYKLHPVFEALKAQAEQGKFYLPAVVWKYSEAMGKEMTKGCQDVVAGVSKAGDIPANMDKKKAELDQAQN